MADDATDPLAAHETLVQALLHAPVPGLPPGPRQLVQTHISSLVLAGERVLKLRKPLKLPFLDFSTLEKRHADCLEEVRLNRRTAPELYLGVKAIAGTRQAPRLEDDDPAPLDWAVWMHRFEESQRLDRLADAGLLTPADLDTLATAIADFQAAQPPSPPGFGSIGEVRRWALENFDELQPHPSMQPHRGRLQALRDWTLAQLARHAGTIEARRAGGFVREGHGDLHLGNLVMLDGRPKAFDCAEFNPALRHIDVVCDLAFSFMDLHRHGLHGGAWRLASAWADRSGDHAGLVLLPLHATYRALVRAKVALLRAGQEGAADLPAAERDLALAEQLAGLDHPARPPRLVLTCGLSGSGKSTVAAMLGEALGAPRLRSDVERKRLHGLRPGERPDAERRQRLYSPAASRRTFNHLAALARTLLQGGLDVIVDAAFLSRRERDRFRRLAAGLDAPVALVHCVAPLAVMQQRLRARQQRDDDPSDADEAVLQAQRERHDPVTADEAATVVDTDCELSTLRGLCQALADGWKGSGDNASTKNWRPHR